MYIKKVKVLVLLIVLVALTMPSWAYTVNQIKAAGAKAEIGHHDSGNLVVSLYEDAEMGRILESLVLRGLAVPTENRGIVLKPHVTEADIASVMVLGNEIAKSRNELSTFRNNQILINGLLCIWMVCITILILIFLLPAKEKDRAVERVVEKSPEPKEKAASKKPTASSHKSSKKAV